GQGGGLFAGWSVFDIMLIGSTSMQVLDHWAVICSGLGGCNEVAVYNTIMSYPNLDLVGVVNTPGVNTLGGPNSRVRGVEDIDRTRLAKCVKDKYNITLTNFTQSAAGSNGFFAGKDSSGKLITVENDVGSYTLNKIRVISWGDDLGYTSNLFTFSAKVNYT